MSSKNLSARQMKTQANYNLVLNKSIELFNEQGYDQTTITDISRATGLSNGSIYHLFKGKDDILRQIYSTRINVSLGLTNDLTEKVMDPYRYLLQFMLDTQELWLSAGPMLLINKYRWVTSRTMMGCSPIQREELLAFISLAQKRGTISNKSDPASLVELLFTVQRGILYGWTSRDDFDIRQYSKLFWPPIITELIKGNLSLGENESLHS